MIVRGEDAGPAPISVSFLRRPQAAFTLTELLVSATILTILAATLAPTLARTKPNSRAIVCQNNLRQFTAAWTMYCTDYGDRVPNNFGGTEAVTTLQTGRLENWVNNVMTWGVGVDVTHVSNTNVAWVTNGVMGKYLSGAIGVYHCPSDTYLSAVQRSAGWSGRLRSISMNLVFGRFSTTNDPTASGLNMAFPQYVQYLKGALVPKPAKTWLVLDEHPDSINYGCFINNPSTSSWLDIPASYHDGGCGVAFVDGHTELKRWQSPTSWYRIQYSYPAQKNFDTLGRADFTWYLSRTGWVLASTGQGQFGY